LYRYELQTIEGKGGTGAIITGTKSTDSLRVLPGTGEVVLSQEGKHETYAMTNNMSVDILLVIAYFRAQI